MFLSPHSPLWPAIFEYERAQLRALLGDGARIEHIGSTAVPGLGAKPIIDILVGMASLEAIDARIPALEGYGYRHRKELEIGTRERRYLTRTDGHPGNFHLHAVIEGSPFWVAHLGFRDALREEPALAERYWKLKQRLAARFPDDRAAYADGKGDFIREVLARRAPAGVK